ncbi:MAG: hypothetical protein ACK559_26850, partial [bacterium]
MDSAASAPSAPPGGPPARTWISGTTGFLGQWVCREMSEDILIRPTRAEAPLERPGALAAHLRASGATRAVHLAAAAGEHAHDLAQLKRLNVDAAREVVEAAMDLQ